MKFHTILSLTLQRGIERGAARAALAGIALALGLAAWALWWPQRLASSQALWVAAEQERAAAAAPLAAPRETAELPARRIAPAQAGAVFAAIHELAEVQQVSIGKVEYRWDDTAAAEPGAPSAPRRVQVNLPLQAGYPALREFVRALREHEPALTIDQLSVRQPSSAPAEGPASDGLLEARLSMSLWLQPAQEPR